MMLTSLRQKLIFFILTGTFLIWALVIVKIHQDTRSEIFELFDAHLAQSARVLLYLVAEELYEEHDEEEMQQADINKPVPIQEIEQHLEKHKYEKILAFQITVERLNFNFRSAIAPEEKLSGETSGFSVNTIDGTRWRVFSLSDPENIIVIRVGEPVSVRTELLQMITWNLVLPILLAFPLLALLIWKIIGHTLSPLSDLATTIKRRDPNQLTPIDEDHRQPDEIRPLLHALNQLLDRLNKTLENERRFTADAAHELRTPLAGIKTQAQLAMHTDDSSTRSAALHQIVRSIDRCTHLSEQLLAMARLEPDYTLGSHNKIALTDIVQDVLTELDDSIVRNGTSITTRFADECSVHGNVQTLHVMIRNLIDNAIRYSGENGHIQVGLEKKADQALLSIDDDGPGIDDDQVAQVFNRFYRVNSMEGKGCGLGLSIARRIAELHGADIRLARSSLGGLHVEMTFNCRPENRHP